MAAELWVQQIDQHPLRRHGHPMRTVLARATGGLAQVEPVGGAITGPLEAGGIDEGLDQSQGPGVFALPVLAQATQHQTQDMTGQLRHSDPG